MEIIKFTLEGQFALFKVPNINLNYLTFSHIPKPTLLGLLGAINGYRGYRDTDSEEVIPEYLTKFKDLEVGIVPKRFNFIKSFYKFNNSSGCATNTNKVANLISSFQVLENVSWDIYIKDNGTESYKVLKENLLNGLSTFIPYLGNNSFAANIKSVDVLDSEEVKETSLKCNSLVETVSIEDNEMDLLDKLMQDTKEYKFNLPKDMDENLMYAYSNFTLTNGVINIKEIYRNKFLNIDDKVVYFY